MEPTHTPSSHKKFVKVLITSMILLLVAAGVYVIFPSLKQQASTAVKSAQDIKDELFTSPLIGNENDRNAQLTKTGVITHTNTERTTAGMPILTENIKLNAAAESKLQDMFNKQYFEHVSPQGNGPGYVAEKAGYTYIIIGENLALGNFKDDAALVAAWMASPGHRANILQTRFKEIGVAVGKGMYQGKETWLAVQEFGSPLSDCPEIDQSLKNQIDTHKETSAAMNVRLEALQNQLKTMPRSTAEQQKSYNATVKQYNDLVVSYDAAVTSLKAEIEAYNARVRAFNTCIKA